MKKLLLIIIIFIALSSNGQTSIYHPFPDSNAVWNIQCSFYCWLPPYDIGGKSYSITFSNDTVIGSQSYHKLIIPFDPPYTSICGGGPAQLNVYKGAIRQDSSIKKVFIVPPTYNTEQLLYDFNMQVGDTVQGYIASCTIIVKSIDSVLVGSSYRKRWLVGFPATSPFHIDFIEGIGSTYGLVELFPCPTDQPDISINCFKQNGQSLYPSTTTNCELITSVNSIDKISNEINIFPNPSNGSFTIDLDNAVIKEIKLYDLLGNIIFCKQTNNQTKFNIDNLQRGVYILTLIDKNNRTTNRKIISSP